MNFREFIPVWRIKRSRKQPTMEATPVVVKDTMSTRSRKNVSVLAKEMNDCSISFLKGLPPSFIRSMSLL